MVSKAVLLLMAAARNDVMGICDGRSRALTMGLTGSAIVVGNLLLATEVGAQERPVADPTLGTEVVPVSPTIDVIEGGAIDGQNLFHSFSEFNIGEGRGVYFFSPTVDIQTIFSRVTGVNRSDILGTLGTIGNSAPDLWLINPNGILFGPNASLDLGGSFVATTANAVQVGDLLFPATEEPENFQILNVDRSVFFFDVLSEARITNQSQATSHATGLLFDGPNSFAGLQVSDNKAIGLVGRTIEFDGGVLNAPFGNIILSSIDSVELENGANVIGGDVFVESDRISLQNGSRLLAEFIDIERLDGSLQILNENGQSSLFFDPNEQLQELSAVSGGNIAVLARGSVTVSGTTPDEQFSSLIGSIAVGLLGSGGDLRIETPNLVVSDGGQISSDYYSVSEQNEGGGNISITASSISVVGESNSGIQPSGIYIGNNTLFSPTDGSIVVKADELSLLGGAGIASSNISQSVLPDNTQTASEVISISAPDILVSGISETGNPSFISASSGFFSGAQIVPLSLSSERLVIQEGGQIAGRSIELSGRQISIKDNSAVGNTVVFPEDEARVDITADEGLTIQNGQVVGSLINLLGNQVSIEDGSTISTATTFNNDKAELNITADEGLTIQNGQVIGSLINLLGNQISIENGSNVSTATTFNNDKAELNITADEALTIESGQITGSLISLSGSQVSIENDSTVGAAATIFTDEAEINVESTNFTVEDDAQLIGNSTLFVTDSITIRDNARVNRLNNLGQDYESLPAIIIQNNSQIGFGEGDGQFNNANSSNVLSFRGSSVNVQDNAQIAGNLNLSAINSISIEDAAQIRGDTTLESNVITLQDNALVEGNSINLFGENIVLSDQSKVSSDELDFGDGGTIDISVTFLRVLDSAQISASVANTGNGGTVDITAYDSEEGIGFVELIGDPFSDDPSSLSATLGGPGNGGQIYIDTGVLRIQNGSQITTEVNGGGNGGNINILAREALIIEGASNAGRPSSISAETNLEGGEFGVIRNIRSSERSYDSVFLLAENTMPIFVVGRSGVIIDATQRDESLDLENLQPFIDRSINGANVLVVNRINTENIEFSDLIVPSPFSDMVEDILSGQRNYAIRSFGITDEILPFGIGIQSPSFSDSSDFLSNGLFLIGQSFNTDFEGSISGGETISIAEDTLELELYEQLFLSSLVDIENNPILNGPSISNESEHNTTGDISQVQIANSLGTNTIGIISSRINGEVILRQFVGPGQNQNFPTGRNEPQFQTAALITTGEVAAIRESFEDGAGEFYVVESTGNEFRIQDDTFTDTRFLNIQPGDLFLIFAVRDGGDININTGDLIVRDGAQITTNSLGAAQGNAAASNLTINAANSVLIDNNSSIAATASTGSGGNLSIQTSELQLTNNSILSAAARANASGGRIIINSTGDVTAVDSDILTNSEQAGGGGIEINARDIYLEGDSDLRTSVAAGEGDGGNITLSGRYIFAFDDSDILADAEGGRGGNIQLNVRGFFGESFTLDSLNADPDTLDGNDRVDVNATGTVNGVVEIPDINFIENSVTNLPDAITPADQILAGSCISRAVDEQGSFVVTGGGGLPTRPTTGNVVSTYPTGEVQSPNATSQAQWQPGDAIVEPTGVYELDDGRLVLSQECDDN